MIEQVLITGATGFIGCRLAEIACERGIPVTALVRNWSRASRLARLPVRMVPGDVRDSAALETAMQGCDVIFHCAVDTSIGGKDHRRANAEATVSVMEAAMKACVRRVVHVSSVAVYSYRPAPDAATEAGAYRYSGDAYCDGKIDAEKAALRYCWEHGVPVTVLRPTIVYGPFGGWTIGTAADIRSGRTVLIDGGSGICNSLYVDNLVDAMLLAATHDRAVGEVFHISDAAPVSWRAFLEGHAAALGAENLPLPELSHAELLALAEARRRSQPSSCRQTLRLIRDPDFRRELYTIPAVVSGFRIGRAVVTTLLPAAARSALRRRILGGEHEPETSDTPVAPSLPELPSPEQVEIYRTPVTFSIEKAVRLLGYAPRVDFAAGMARTAAWLQWARL